MADMAQQNVSQAHSGDTRRDFLYLTAGAIGGVGIAATIWPFIDTLNPARDTLALSTTEVDLAPIQVGQRLTVAWRGKPVFIAHRTAEEIKAAESVDISQLRDPQKDSDRVQNPEWLIIVGVCTHLGCIPLVRRPETIAVHTAAGSVRAMARCTTPPDASGRDPRRSTSRSRRTNSSQTPRSGSADASDFICRVRS